MNRVTKEIAIALKDIGYDVPCNDYYMTNGEKCHGGYFNWNFGTRASVICSAPTVYEAIEWLFEKNVLVLPVLSWLESDTPFGYQVWVRESKDMEWHEIHYSNQGLSRLAAYTAGLPIAIDYIKNKIE